MLMALSSVKIEEQSTAVKVEQKPMIKEEQKTKVGKAKLIEDSPLTKIDKRLKAYEDEIEGWEKKFSDADKTWQKKVWDAENKCAARLPRVPSPSFFPPPTPPSHTPPGLHRAALPAISLLLPPSDPPLPHSPGTSPRDAPTQVRLA